MVEEVRAGMGQREVARRYKVGLATVQLWVGRATGKALDEVDWSDRSSAPQRVHNRTEAAMEIKVVQRRKELQQHSDLGFYGAQEIRASLVAEGGPASLPSVRTIGRIFQRRGVLDHRRRLRWVPPPPGWYLPEVAARRAELDRFDVIEDLRIEGYGLVNVLSAHTLWGPFAGAWPMEVVSAQATVECLQRFWQAYGLPHFAQFDNDTRFQGGHNHPDVVGRVARVCLSLGVTPVFAPPREHGFQAHIENLNDLWQAKVWHRFHHLDLPGLIYRSDRFVRAYIHRRAQRIDHSPTRRAFPSDWRINLQTHPRGCLIYLRRTNEHGRVYLLGRTFPVDPTWLHRLVRCEVCLDENEIRFYRLRRREPNDQPLLKTISYHLPQRRFRE